MTFKLLKADVVAAADRLLAERGLIAQNAKPGSAPKYRSRWGMSPVGAVLPDRIAKKADQWGNVHNRYPAPLGDLMQAGLVETHDYADIMMLEEIHDDWLAGKKTEADFRAWLEKIR